MTAFEFIDPYQDADDSIEDIDADNSDADVQNIFSDVKQLDITTVQRELADTTIAIQKPWRKRSDQGSPGICFWYCLLFAR